MKSMDGSSGSSDVNASVPGYTPAFNPIALIVAVTRRSCPVETVPEVISSDTPITVPVTTKLRFAPGCDIAVNSSANCRKPPPRSKLFPSAS